MKKRTTLMNNSCPKCNSEKVASILFGLPQYDEKLKKDILSKKVVLGGCFVNREFNPNYRCLSCLYQWEEESPMQGKFIKR